jgi:ankyrin repeat protein
MIQPPELKLDLSISLPGNTVGNTTQVWDILNASNEGNIDTVMDLVDQAPELAYAQYNYHPPIHFAVREGHTSLVRYFLNLGALDPTYTTYPFGDTLLTIAEDRGHVEIILLLQKYLADPSRSKFKGDNGKIDYKRSKLQQEFEQAVNKEDVVRVGQILNEHPKFALDQTYFWSEGILTFAAKDNNRKMIDLLMSYGAKVPDILKWTANYYFERLDGATYMMEKGMNPNTKSWQNVTILHDMAERGLIDKAALLLDYGAEIDPIDDEYRSTPLGLAARWGHTDMVEFLLQKGADPHKSGARWSGPMAWATRNKHSEVISILQKAS